MLGREHVILRGEQLILKAPPGSVIRLNVTLGHDSLPLHFVDMNIIIDVAKRGSRDVSYSIVHPLGKGRCLWKPSLSAWSQHSLGDCRGSPLPTRHHLEVITTEMP